MRRAWRERYPFKFLVKSELSLNQQNLYTTLIKTWYVYLGAIPEITYNTKF